MVKDENEVVRPAEPARTANALLKRAEQLKRWEESETNKESGALKPILARKVKFPEGCVFLAACASGDIDEVEHLLEKGADINTTNVDGLTALHQAVIDQNLDMVQFLIDNNADIDAQDNEGWTPLMAGISCNFLDVVRFLLDKNADPALLNNDGELPIDLAETDEMRSVIESEIRRKGINLEEARNREEQLMIVDAVEWANSSKITRERRHPKTGASPLHVAAAKGYSKVMGILLQAGADVNAKDFDGWTPLHAAAHWGERDAIELLVESMANMEEKNLLGQTCFVVADADMMPFLEAMKKKQEAMKEKRPSVERTSESGLNREYKSYTRKNSVTRTSTGDKMKITKADEVKEAEVFRASSSEASDNEEEEVLDEEEEKDVKPNAERKRSDTSVPNDDVQPAKVSKQESNGIAIIKTEPSKPKEDKEKSQTIIITPVESTSMNVTSVVPFPVASVSVTVQQPLTVGRSMTVVSSAKNENSKVSALQKNFGPPVIIPSEPPQPPSWRLTGRRISASGLMSPPQSPTVVPLQSSSSATNSSLPSLTLSATNPLSPSTSTSNVDAARWRKRYDGNENSAPNIEDKNRPKFPWLRSSSAPAVRTSTVVSPPLVGASPLDVLKKPSTLNLPFSNSDKIIKTDAKNFSNESPTATTTTTTTKSPQSPPFSSVSFERESRKPTITTPLSLAKQHQPQQTFVKQPSTIVHSALTATNFSPPIGFGVRGGTVASHFTFGSPTSSANLTPIMENVATRSFTPPQRADESEAERKARAKRERETRRSTQGITLETVKAAEQLYSDRKKPSADETSSSAYDKERLPIKTSAAVFELNNPAKIDEKISRPKIWERISTSTIKPLDSSSTNHSTTVTATPIETVSTSGSSLLTKNLTSSHSPYPWRTTRIQIGDSNQSSQPLRPVQPEDQRILTDKESSDKSPGGSAAVLNRRRTRPNRRSTGPIAQEDVQLAIENDLEADENVTTTEDVPSTYVNDASSISTNLSSGGGRYSASDDNQNDKKTTTTSTYSSSNIDSSNLSGYRNNRYPLTKVGNLSDRSSRTSSGVSVGGSGTASPDVEVDYKKLFEKEKSENDRLRDVIKELEKSVENMKLSPKQASGDGLHIIGYDTRLERRVAELEEENKTLEQVKADNQRLKEENGALIRVISKLSKSK